MASATILKIIVLLIAFGGASLVSLLEAAFFGMPVRTVKEQAESGNRECSLLLELRSQTAVTVSGLLFVHMVLAILCGVMLGLLSFAGEPSVAVITFFAVIQLMFAEIIPKVYGLTHAEALAPRLARTIRTVVSFVMPVAWAGGCVARLFVRLIDK